MDEIIDQITLTLDDDSELLCNVLATFPAIVNGKKQMYIALLSTDATPESEIYLYRFIENGDDIDLQNIEDDKEFYIVSDAFDELLEEKEFDELFEEEENEESFDSYKIIQLKVKDK